MERYSFTFDLSGGVVRVTEAVGSHVLTKHAYRLDKWEEGAWEELLSEERNQKFMERGYFQVWKNIDDLTEFLREWVCLLLYDAGFLGLYKETPRLILRDNENFRELLEGHLPGLRYAQFHWYENMEIEDISMLVAIEVNPAYKAHFAVTYRDGVFQYNLDDELSSTEQAKYDAGERGVNATNIIW